MPRSAKRYTVHRAQDGAQVRAELTLKEAERERSDLNAQARILTGQDIDGNAIYASMFHGEISKYEIRSADGLVIS